MIDLRVRYSAHLRLLEEVMRAELAWWPWDAVGRLGSIVDGQIRNGGKRLRPLTALLFAELHGGEPGRVAAPAAGVEFYHLAALVLDDVQDNSAVRRGNPSVPATSGISTAINVAATIRSLSYHPIHRSNLLDPDEKLSLHRELDEAATRIVLGQSIDIGWNEGWYKSHFDFPYERMLEWKTGSLFGCAAAMGALTAGATAAEVDSARRNGTNLGVLFQLIDDYLDVFGRALTRPAFEDFRGAKMSGPVIYLLRALHAAGREDEAESVSRRLAGANDRSGDWGWLLSLLAQMSIEQKIIDDLWVLAGRLGEFTVDGQTRHDVGVADIVGLMMSAVHSEGRDANGHR